MTLSLAIASDERFGGEARARAEGFGSDKRARAVWAGTMGRLGGRVR